MTEQPKSPRVMLALIALADLPMPDGIRWQPGILSMTFGSLADGQAWSRHLGGRDDTYLNSNGRRFLDEGAIRWHGWSIQLHAAAPEPAPEVELDADTAAALRAVAEGGEPA